MLGISSSPELIEKLWASLPLRAQLPCSEDEFFAKEAGPGARDSRRRFHRFPLRRTGILQKGEAFYAIYTKDLSRMGVGFLSPIQLFPREHITVWLPQQKLRLITARCRRLERACYECGTLFDGHDEMPA